MTIVAILQARFSSTRLPGKVLLPVLGVPMLMRQVERLQRVQRIDHLVIATSSDPTDDCIAALCHQQKWDCYRGSSDDVLDRFYQTACREFCEHVVRLTGDCPLTDPSVIDAVIDYHLAVDWDYTSNALEPTFPDGLDVEIMRFTCLRTAWKEASLPSHREHVTPFLYQQPERFQIGHFKQAENLSHLRWTVDERADLEFVRQVYANLYRKTPNFSTDAILALLSEQPQLANINQGFKRNEGYAQSVANESQQLPIIAN
jgi:spore coat polysaccharide biosynthesis protein SpsF